MSEIKPWGYISPSATKTLLDRSKCDLTITRKATHNITMPLYTADQLAEAVAAERELCIQLVRNEGVTPAIPDDPSEEGEAINTALHSAIKNIRSAAK